MKVIHSYADKQGIIWKELLYTQYLSAVLVKKHYGNVHFYGDEGTSKIVSDLGLPYDEINNTLLSSKDSETWSLPKLKVFKETKEPFLHIDTDTLMFSKIDFESYSQDYLFSHRDMSIPDDTKENTLKNLYMTWFFNMAENSDPDLKTKYPFRDFAIKFKEYVPEGLIYSGKRAYKEYFYMNETYTKLFFDMLENIGSEVFDNVHFKSIPNMNITYVRNYLNFAKATEKSLEHYYDNKKRIDSENYGPCYIEQFMIHTQLRFLDKKYKKSSQKGKNFIFNSIPGLLPDGHNNVDRIEKVKFPFKINYLNNRHFKCSCCGEEVISKLSKINPIQNYDQKTIDSIDDIINFFEDEFNGFLHLTYFKWYDIFQVYIIDKLRKEVGDEKIREIHKYYGVLYPPKNLSTTSRGESLYTKLTGFNFKSNKNNEVL